MSIASGTRLGPYEIVESIGAGGMGEVWRARDTRLDREVAIKVLPAGFAENEQFLQRFEREARTISSLNHPHICTLYDVGEAAVREGEAPAVGASTTHYLVMELIEGESLADRLKKGPLPLHEVLRYGRQIASALDAAHKRGVVHRDLKPGNVMLTKSGAKLLDFGLAKSATESSPIEGLTSMPTEAKPLTMEGTILGTFQYMAPEQLEGLEADARTDIFALGALLYEMATGRRAFQGETKTSLIAAIVSQQPEPISQVTPMTPPALDHVVRRCLEKDPDDRWQSAQDIASELQWISEAGSQAGVAAPVTLRRKTREKLAWTLVALLFTICAILGFLLSSSSGETPRPSLDLTLSPPPNAYLKLGNQFGGGLISPDGRRVVFAAENSDGTQLWIRSLGQDDSRPIPGTEGAAYPFWSPDSRSIAYFNSGGRPMMKRIELEGGLPQTISNLGPDGAGRGGSWRSDGTIIYGAISGNLRRVPPGGGDPSGVTTLDIESGETAHYWPQFVGSGEKVLYFIRNTRKDREGLYLGTLGPDGKETSRTLLVAASGSGRFVPGESATKGHLIWPREGRLLARPADIEKGELYGETSDLGIDVGVIDAQRGSLFSVSDDGTIVAVSPLEGDDRLIAVDRSGRNIEILFEARDAELVGPTTSPDGRYITFGHVSSGDQDLWIYDRQASRAVPLTFGEDYDEAIGQRWSADSTELIMPSWGSAKRFTPKRVTPAGGTPPVELKQSMAPVWYRKDGWYLGVDESGALRRLRFDQDDPGDVIAREVLGGNVSPDGRWMALLVAPEHPQLELRPFTVDDNGPAIGSSVARVPYDFLAYEWSRGGREIVVRKGRSLLVMELSEDGSGGATLGAPVELFSIPSLTVGWTIGTSPDGETFYLTSNPGIPTQAVRVVTNWRSRL